MRVILLDRYRSGGIPTANMLFRYDGTVGVTDAGSGAVSAWADQSGNGRDLSQGTGANRPTTGVATLNGKNGVRFASATAQSLSTGTISSFGPAKTVYIVCRMVGTIPDTTTYYNIADSNQVQYLDVGGGTASGAQAWVYAYDGSIRHVTGWMSDTPMCWTARFNGNTASSSLMRRNGVNLGSAFTGATAANNTITSFRLGANSGSNSPAFDVFEVIGYSVKHTDAEVAAVEAALQAKWAFAPSSGPFANRLWPADYFDFSDTASITEAAGLVSSVANKGLTGNAATASGTARPTTGVNTINGKNVLNFDGSSDWLAVATTIQNRGNTVLAIIKTNGFTTSASIFGPSGNGSFLLRVDVTTGKLSILKSNIVGIGTATNALTDATATAVGGTYSWNTRYRFVQAGALNGSGSTTVTMTNTNTVQIGRDRATSDFFKGDIGALASWPGYMNDDEFLAYDALLRADGWGL